MRQPLDQKVIKSLTSSLQKSPLFDKPPSKIEIQNIVNPQILGGIIVEYNDKTIDMSLSSKVNKLNRLLDAAV